MNQGNNNRNIPSNIKQDIYREYTRLSPEAYTALEKQVLTASMSTTTTELQAAAMVGAEMVLRKLRNGFVIGA